MQQLYIIIQTLAIQYINTITHSFDWYTRVRVVCPEDEKLSYWY